MDEEPIIAEPEQPARRPRRFTLLDMILLVAAVAVGQRGYISVQSIYGFSPGQVITNIQKVGLLARPWHVLFWFEVAAPMLLALMATLFVSRRLRPRPPGPELGRQPGGVAISSAFFGALVVFAAWFVLRYSLALAGKLDAAGLMQKNGRYPFVLSIMRASLVASGASVASGWASLVLNGAKVDDPDWVEWAGRILGILLVTATPFYLWSTLLYN